MLSCDRKACPVFSSHQAIGRKILSYGNRESSTNGQVLQLPLHQRETTV
jgi:hypothetical protein